MSNSNKTPSGGCRPLRQSDLKPWERFNELGQLEIDLKEAEKNGYKITRTVFAVNEGDTEFTEDLTGDKYIVGSPRKRAKGKK